MKITVYGATGYVGQAIFDESVERGHNVVSVTRSGPGIVSDEKVTSKIANFGDIATLKELDVLSDVIVISIAPDRTGLPHEPLLEAHRQLIAHGMTSRIFIVGGAGALEIDGVLLKDAPDFPEMFKPEATTMKSVLDLYRSSTDVNWTMIAPPPGIMPGERSGNYIVGKNSPVGASISTQDFAIAVLDEIEAPQHIGERFTVAN
jgi:putative NADH-flavin reductase